MREITGSRFLKSIFCANSATFGAEVHQPFGGTKAVDKGSHDVGIQASDVFSEWKSCHVDFPGTLQKAQFDAYPGNRTS